MSVIIDTSVKNQQNSPILYTGTLAQINASGHVANRWLIASDTFDLYRDNGTTYDRIGGPGTGTITGTGTSGTIPLFSAAAVIGDSILTQSGTDVISSGGLKATTFKITSATYSTITGSGAFGLDLKISGDDNIEFWTTNNSSLQMKIAESGYIQMYTNLTAPGITTSNYLTTAGASAFCSVTNGTDTGIIHNFSNIQYYQSTGTKLLNVVAPALSVGTITVTLPSSTGTLALTSALSSYLPLTAGSGQPLTGNLYLNGSSCFVYVGSGTDKSYLGNNALVFIQNSGSNVINIVPPTLTTATRTLTLPDVTGTIAVTSDLSAYMPLAAGSSNYMTGQVWCQNASQAGFWCNYTGTGALKASVSTYNDTFLIYDETNGRSVFTYTPSTNKIVMGTSIKTSAPSGGTAADWKFGIYVAGVIVPTGYVEIDINGTLRKVAAL